MLLGFAWEHMGNMPMEAAVPETIQWYDSGNHPLSHHAVSKCARILRFCNCKDMPRFSPHYCIASKGRLVSSFIKGNTDKSKFLITGRQEGENPCLRKENFRYVDICEASDLESTSRPQIVQGVGFIVWFVCKNQILSPI